MINFIVKVKKKKMKTLLFCIVVFCSRTIFFSQEYSVIANAQPETELVSAKTNGIFKFYFPTSITMDKITSSATYYTDYFTVGYDEPTHSVLVSMINNTSQNRRVIMRFLMTARIQKIKVDNTEMFIQDFYNEYLH